MSGGLQFPFRIINCRHPRSILGLALKTTPNPWWSWSARGNLHATMHGKSKRLGQNFADLVDQIELFDVSVPLQFVLKEHWSFLSWGTLRFWNIEAKAKTWPNKVPWKLATRVSCLVYAAHSNIFYSNGRKCNIQAPHVLMLFTFFRCQ